MHAGRGFDRYFQSGKGRFSIEKKIFLHFGDISVPTAPVVEVETALPAFVGYTAKATGKVFMDLIPMPTKINSMREFENYFGLPYDSEIAITIHKNSDNEFSVCSFNEVTLKYLLY